jgi:hypothetical protein
MIDDPSPEPRDSGTPSAQAPEGCFWPLVALVLVILPQVLVPSRLRQPVRRALHRRFDVGELLFDGFEQIWQSLFDRILEGVTDLHGDVHPGRRYRHQKGQVYFV